MITKRITSSQLEILKNNHHVVKDQSLYFINPDDTDQLLRLYPKELAEKEYSLENLENASEIQPHIKFSTLPLGALYVDDVFSGSILKNHHKCQNTIIFPKLPIRIQINILKNLVRNIKELSDNNVYHLALSTINYDSPLYDFSSILLSKSGEVIITNLDSDSTQYLSTNIPFLEFFMREATNEVVYKLLSQSLTKREDQIFYRKKDLSTKREMIRKLCTDKPGYEEIGSTIDTVLSLK